MFVMSRRCWLGRAVAALVAVAAGSRPAAVVSVAMVCQRRPVWARLTRSYGNGSFAWTEVVPGPEGRWVDGLHRGVAWEANGAGDVAVDTVHRLVWPTPAGPPAFQARRCC